MLNTNEVAEELSKTFFDGKTPKIVQKEQPLVSHVYITFYEKDKSTQEKQRDAEILAWMERKNCRKPNVQHGYFYGQRDTMISYLDNWLD